MMSLPGSQGPVVEFQSMSASDTDYDSNTAASYFTVHSDGRLTVTGNGTTTTYNWFKPAVSGVGNSFWYRVNDNGSSPTITAPFSKYENTWYQITGDDQWSYTKNTSYGTGTANVTVDFSTNSSGTQHYATANISLTSTLDTYFTGPDANITENTSGGYDYVQMRIHAGSKELQIGSPATSGGYTSYGNIYAITPDGSFTVSKMARYVISGPDAADVSITPSAGPWYGSWYYIGFSPSFYLSNTSAGTTKNATITIYYGYEDNITVNAIESPITSVINISLTKP